ncbi:MAG TPA: NADH-quinone oxidoreductase subunit C, partial [Pyrinomonadaceae bacterium]|nr:NADH-quinone oxidoreductase subunit C [Pyrinomonadaceae bacterium]
MSQDIEREKEVAPAARRATYPLPPAELVSALRAEHEGWFTDSVEAFGELTLIVPREHIAEVCAHLKTAPGFEFDMLADLCGADRGPEEEPRFEVNYHLFSTKRYHRMRLKVLLNQEDTHVPTVTTVWRTANWHERETFDM